MSYEKTTFIINPSSNLSHPTPPPPIFTHHHPIIPNHHHHHHHLPGLHPNYASHPILIPTGLSPHGNFSIIPHPPPPPPPTTLCHQSTPRRIGFCKFFNVGKGFGFIQDSRPEELPTMNGDPGTDIFVHFSCIMACEAPYKSLLDGEQVEYYLGRSNKGLAALEITGPGGVPVKGCNTATSRSPTVLQPTPTFSGPIPIMNYPPGSHSLKSPSNHTTPNVSPSFESHSFQSVHPHSALSSRTSNGIPNRAVSGPIDRFNNISPTFPLAVGVPLGIPSAMRREVTTTESLGLGQSTKMYRISSTPISAPGFGSTNHKIKDAGMLASLGVGIGIGVHWEPKARGQIPQWSPPGGRRVSLKDQANLHFPSTNARRAGDPIDRTKSNWRQEPTPTQSPQIQNTEGFSPTISV